MVQQTQKIRQLNQLLVINHNAERAYLEALESAENEELKQFFRARAFERNEFCRYLGAEIRLLGGAPNFSDTIDSKTKINWPDFKKVLASKNPRALFNEINRLKSACVAQYNRVLNSFEFQESLANLLEKQKQIIGSSISLMRYKDGLTSAQPRLASNG
ncbi:DUF2383 domain-containing protein [Hyunsoonleella sp. SJ7]|uniref:DUF2383 domain-containing protein n=1 Tax=Hyunsoonleella aquatilis TaxID=2762758 RepID=A0A923HBS0_9FLAO|nr:DUF2383 domain-containing protein [Hyunsoonleella aquatilis]MBC3758186.1 DUF2383 domain-containing protein [Hyunsoonleella aquatilis]